MLKLRNAKKDQDKKKVFLGLNGALRTLITVIQLTVKRNGQMEQTDKAIYRGRCPTRNTELSLLHKCKFCKFAVQIVTKYLIFLRGFIHNNSTVSFILTWINKEGPFSMNIITRGVFRGGQRGHVPPPLEFRGQMPPPNLNAEYAH